MSGIKKQAVGIGVVGYGYWGPNLVRNFVQNQSARVVGVCDSDAAKLAACKRYYPSVGLTDRFPGLD